MDKTTLKTIKIISSVLLLIAIMDLPYGYYTFLRLAITASATLVLISYFSVSVGLWGIIFTGIALLFNPIIPVYLDKELWVIIDVVVAMLFIVSIFSSYQVTKK